MDINQAGPGSGETLDPVEALRFTEQVRAVAEDLHTSLETSVTSLRSRGVTGAPIELLTRMQHTAHALITDADAAEAHFARHLSLADQISTDITLAATLAGTYLGAPDTATPTPTARRPRRAAPPAPTREPAAPSAPSEPSEPSAPLGRPVPRTSVEDRIRAAYRVLGSR